MQRNQAASLAGVAGTRLSSLTAGRRVDAVADGATGRDVAPGDRVVGDMSRQRHVVGAVKSATGRRQRRVVVQ